MPIAGSTSLRFRSARVWTRLHLIQARLAFASGAEGVLTVGHEDSPNKFGVAENVPTERGVPTMTFDLTSHQIFLVTAKCDPPPAATGGQPHPRPAILCPTVLGVLVVGR